MSEKAIMMTDADRVKWYDVLVEYYRKKGMDEADIILTIDKVFAQAQVGWNRAPNDIDTRIKMKTGFQWKSHNNLKPKQKQVLEKSIATEEDDDEDIDLVKSMNKFEQAWWRERREIYQQDFEFNDSSDKPLLDQLMLEELMQKRLFKSQIKNKNQNYGKQLTESLKRVTELQTKLGITREQRAGIMNKIDGNVAHLALSLEEKLRDMPERMRKEYEDEVYYQNLKDQKPPINILPPLSKVEAMLSIDGKVSANLDSTRISEISEEVNKEIADKREREEDKKKNPPKKELADGVDLS